MHNVKHSPNFYVLAIPCAHWSMMHQRFYQNGIGASLPRMIMNITCSKNILFKSMRENMHFLTLVLSEAWSRKLNTIGSFIGMCRSNTKSNIIIHFFFLLRINAILFKKLKYGKLWAFHSCSLNRDVTDMISKCRSNLSKHVKIRIRKMLIWLISPCMPCAQSTVKLCTQVMHFVD